ncbi:MAG: hypothetical protein OXI96_03480 [Acidimicrobiaceae bacterium]|nr:hypothetical protein [Acidimicrobiaceae bacterium]
MQSWGLTAVAQKFNIPLTHHDALSDAEAAGRIWVELAYRSSFLHEELLDKHGYRLGYYDSSGYQPFSNADLSQTSASSESSWSSSFTAKDFTPMGTPDPEGALFGRKVVFTGKLTSMPRREAFQLAVDVGAKPVESVSGKTDYLVVGYANGHQTSKYKKALHSKSRETRFASSTKTSSSV